jgi:hypothetical protein
MFKVQQPEVMKLLTREARNGLLDAVYGNYFTLYLFYGEETHFISLGVC